MRIDRDPGNAHFLRMTAPSPPRWFSGWAKRLGCLGLVLAGVGSLGLIGLRLVMWRVHREAERRLEHSAQSLPTRAARESDRMEGGSSSRGMALSDIPRLGPALSGDDPVALQSFAADVSEIAEFLRRCGHVRNGGRLDFRALLASLGVALPHGATDAEAAAAFLAQTERFAAFLADWKAAVTSGKWDTVDADGLLQAWTPAFGVVPRLLRIMAEAYWQTGDVGSAWDTVTLMAATTERAFDISRLHSQGSGFAAGGILAETIAGGLEAGVWTDDHLRAVPGLATSLDPIGRLPGYATAAKQTLDLWAARPETLTAGPSIQLEITDPVNSVLSLAHGVMASSSQRHLDNFSMMKAIFDADVASINAETRTLLPAAERAAFDPLKGIEDNWFSSLYFAEAWHMGTYQEASPLATVVTAQSRLDQAVIAARLEVERRSTGEYPAGLPEGLPHDPATGQPYRYERVSDGGFRLWGLGLDQSDQGGDARSDVVWPPKP